MRGIMLESLIVAAFAIAACHTMKPLTLEQLAGVRPSRVWVTRGDRAVVVVEAPQVLNNRLVGFVNGKYQVMPAAEVTELRMRAPAGGRTAALVTASALGAAAMVYLISGGGGSRDPCSLQSSECDPNAP
jgi:hypothetical protein